MTFGEAASLPLIIGWLGLGATAIAYLILAALVLTAHPRTRQASWLVAALVATALWGGITLLGIGTGALRLGALPSLDALDAWVDEKENMLGKTGNLTEAVRYAKQQRVYVRRCFTDGRFEIDNGHVERAIREPAIGRKNFLFTGSTDAAHRLAAAYTLVQTCRALGLSTREYLTDVIQKLEAGWPARRLTETATCGWPPSHATSPSAPSWSPSATIRR